MIKQFLKTESNVLLLEQCEYAIKVNLKDHIAVFWVMTQCRLVDVQKHFDTEGGGSTFL